MYFNRIALFALSCFIILVFFSTKTYNSWLNERLLTWIDEFSYQIDDLSYETRKKIRWENAYVDGINLKHYLDTSHKENPIILIPDDKYVKRIAPKAQFPEPIVYYYLTGLRTVRPYSKNVKDANLAIMLSSTNMTVHTITSKKQLDSLLNLYKN